MVDPPPADATKRLLGERYRLESVIGLGGMATVYEARDESLGRDVAVKVFDFGVLDSARQESELSVLASLDHHGVVSLLDAGVDVDVMGRSRRYLVMSLVHGADLHERLKSAPIAARNIAEIGYDMAEALEYIHARNVIHRDIKPSNILLVDYGDGSPRARAMLTDFGIALFDDMERLTADGQTTGTAAYLSPEQVEGKPVGSASDIYSLGLVLLQCFTRSVEYPGPLIESALARLSRRPRIPNELPEHWHQLLESMTLSDPAERPGGRELVSALRQIMVAESARHKDPDGDAFDSGSAGGVTGEAEADSSPALETIPLEALQRVTSMAARLFSAPIAIVSVVDHDRSWFESYYAPEVDSAARAIDLSRVAIPRDAPLVIRDGQNDPRVSESALVTGPLALRFYASVPLKRGDGQPIGTLSVIDFEPGSATEAEIANLEDLAALAVAQLESRHEALKTGDGSGALSSGSFSDQR